MPKHDENVAVLFRLRRIFRIVAVLATSSLAVGALSGCQNHQQPGEPRTAQWYERHNPVVDANADFLQHDRRIYTAMGIGRYFPGMPNVTGASLEQHHGSRPLGGTTDVISSATEMRYIEAAVNYARVYNREMARLIGAAEEKP